jgi:hypothetical protein
MTTTDAVQPTNPDPPELCDRVTDTSLQVSFHIGPQTVATVRHRPDLDCSFYSFVYFGNCGHRHHGQLVVSGRIADLRRCLTTVLADLETVAS